MEDRTTRLERGVEALLDALQGVRTDLLYAIPGEGEWPVMSTLAHVAEMLPYWANQCAAIAQAPGKQFGRTHDDPGRLQAIDQHGEDALAVIGPSILASLHQALDTLRTIDESRWALRGQHPTRGSMSIQQVVDTFMVGHVDDHLKQVRAALAALGYSPSQVP
jgi:hypothetical protein